MSISAEQVNQPDMQVGFLLGFGKLLGIFLNDCETWQEANVIVLELERNDQIVGPWLLLLQGSFERIVI